MTIQDIIAKPLTPIHLLVSGTATTPIIFRGPVLIRHIYASTSSASGDFIITKDVSGAPSDGWNGNAAAVRGDIRSTANVGGSCRLQDLNWLVTGGTIYFNAVTAAISYRVTFAILYISPKEMRVLQLID